MIRSILLAFAFLAIIFTLNYIGMYTPHLPTVVTATAVGTVVGYIIYRLTRKES